MHGLFTGRRLQAPDDQIDIERIEFEPEAPVSAVFAAISFVPDPRNASVTMAPLMLRAQSASGPDTET